MPSPTSLLDLDVAAQFADDAVADGESEAGADARGLGGEERIEHALASLSGGMPTPVSAIARRAT